MIDLTDSQQELSLIKKLKTRRNLLIKCKNTFNIKVQEGPKIDVLTGSLTIVLLILDGNTNKIDNFTVIKETAKSSKCIMRDYTLKKHRQRKESNKLTKVKLLGTAS